MSLLSLVPATGLLLACIAPLHLLPWMTWHSELPVFVAVVGAAAWALGKSMLVRAPELAVPLPSMALAFLIVALLSVMQAATGLIPFWGDAWVLTLYLVLCTSSFVLGYEVARKDEGGVNFAELLAGTMLSAAVGCSVIALIQALDVWPTWEWIARTPSWRRSGSNLAQPNQMGTLVLMGVVGLVYLHQRRKLSSPVAALLGIVAGLGIVTTESRTALLSLAMLVLWWSIRPPESRLTFVPVVGAVVFVLVGYAMWPSTLTAFHGLDELAQQSAKVNTKVGLRAVVWPQLFEAASERPLLGWGLHQTSAALTTVLDGHPLSEAYTYAHNLVLDLVLGLGVPITLLLIGAAVSWLWRRRLATRDPTGWFALGICIPFAVHAMLEYPHAYAYLLAPVTFALGLVDGRSSLVARLRLPSAVAALGLVLTAGLGVWVVGEYTRIEEDFRVARFESGRIGVTPADYKRPHVRVLTQLGALLEGARVVPQPGMSREQIVKARDVAYRFPWPALQNRYALSLALNGDAGEALRVLRVIRAMHGEQLYSEIRTNWRTLAEGTYPELLTVPLP